MSWIRVLLFALSHFAVVGVARCLALVGARELAEGLCRRAAVWIGDADLLVEVAFIRSRAGDLEGALDVLEHFESPLPQQQWQLLRAIYSGIFCEHNRQAERAVTFFETAIAQPAIQSDTKAALKTRIRRLRPVQPRGRDWSIVP